MTRFPFALLGALLFVPSFTLAQCDEVKLVAADGDVLDRYGYSVDVQGDRLLIVAKHDEAPLADQGSLYIYDRIASDWILDEKVIASDAQAGDLLGWAASLSGDRILAGAVFHDVAVADQGAAYIFERQVSGWVETAKFVAANGATNDFFGRGVALDGDLAVVGAPQTDRSATNSGSAYVYEFSGGSWSMTQELSPADLGANDRFGWDVAVDGDRIVVGAYQNDEAGDDAGAVYVYERGMSGFDQVAKIIPTDATGELGWAVATHQGQIVAGATDDGTFGNRSGAAYVFEGSGATWTQVAKLLAPDAAANDRLGSDVDIHSGRVAVGAQLDDDGANSSGSVYVFAETFGTWGLDTKLTASDPEVDARFGRYVALDDNTVVSGAIHEDTQGDDAGAVYVYRRNGAVTADCFCPVAPCGNDQPMAGCATSTGSGAVLSACGSTSTMVDDLVLSAEGIPANFFGLLYMGGGAVDLPFGDGRRCVGSGGNGVHRFPVRNAGAGGVITEGPGLVAFSNTNFVLSGHIQPGSTWRFQAWFRDPGGPCASGFNLSNALTVTFSM